jgi:hypothetical protein
LTTPTNYQPKAKETPMTKAKETPMTDEEMARGPEQPDTAWSLNNLAAHRVNVEASLQREEKLMSVNCRFALDEKRYVIDTVNAANSGKGYCHEGAPEDDKYLRERVLQNRLHQMLEKLFLNLRPMQKLPTGQEYKPQNEEAFAVWRALLDIFGHHS